MKKRDEKNTLSSMTLKDLSIEIVKYVQDAENNDIALIEQSVREYTGKESLLIQEELLKFIDTYLRRRSFSAEQMHERIENHCKVFAKFRLYEIMARAKVLLASHYHHLYKYFSEALQAATEGELIVQKYLGTDNFIQCEALFVKGGVYYFLGEIEKSTEALLASQTLKGFSQASHALKYKSHINISRNYILLKDISRAKKHLEMAEKNWEHYGRIYDKAGLYMRKSDMLRSSNDWEGALSVLEEGLIFFKGTTFTLRIAEFYKELGEFYWREDNPLKSFELSMSNFEEALNLGRELNIPRLEAAILNSMWKASRSFERWRECAEYSILHTEAIANAHAAEVDIYIKKIEQAAHEEKQRLMKEGKPTYSKSLLDEVVQLRDENEQMKQKVYEFNKVMLDIESLLDNTMNGKNHNGKQLEQLRHIISKSSIEIPTLNQSLMECEKIYPYFAIEIMKKLPTISGMELKVAKLIRLGMKTQSIATLCGVTTKSIENHRMKLRKKAGLHQEQSLSVFLNSL
jgi:DNA-binding CsgD family transcriptional regulator